MQIWVSLDTEELPVEQIQGLPGYAVAMIIHTPIFPLCENIYKLITAIDMIADRVSRCLKGYLRGWFSANATGYIVRTMPAWGYNLVIKYNHIKGWHGFCLSEYSFIWHDVWLVSEYSLTWRLYPPNHRTKIPILSPNTTHYMARRHGVSLIFYPTKICCTLKCIHFTYIS